MGPSEADPIPHLHGPEESMDKLNKYESTSVGSPVRTSGNDP